MFPLLLFTQAVQGFPLLQNITLPLPSGSSNHGTPGLLCTPTRWTDIVVFYLANYAAHAATTRSLPGEKTLATATVVLIALFFPAAGAYRGILGITSLAMFGKTDLQKAARAGALCTLIRTSEWQPQNGDTLPNTLVRAPSSISDPSDTNIEKNFCAASTQEDGALDNDMGNSTQETPRVAMYDPPWLNKGAMDASELHIHGNPKIPPGYQFWLLSRRAKFIEPGQDPENAQTTSIMHNYSLIKILVSLGQSIYAIFTLYQARGDQIAQFGYAAFGLTVAPYAVASILNLLGSLLCPEFLAVYMVESSIMDEARRRGDEYVFEGTVGRLDELVIQRSSNIAEPADETSRMWVFESITINMRDFGEVHANTDLQVGFLSRKIGMPTNVAGEGEKMGTHEPAPAEIGSSSHNHQLDHIRVANMEENDSIGQADSKKSNGQDVEGQEQRTSQHGEPSDSTLNNVLLVPLMNPTRTRRMTGQIYDYEIYHVAPGRWPKDAWRVHFSYNIEGEDPRDYIESRSLQLSFFITAISVAITGAFSRFHKGHSTHAQRVWTMTWLCFSSLGPFFLLMQGLASYDRASWYWRLTNTDDSPSLFFAVGLLMYAAPAIGGFVVVGQMLKSYGNCITVS